MDSEIQTGAAMKDGTTGFLQIGQKRLCRKEEQRSEKDIINQKGQKDGRCTYGTTGSLLPNISHVEDA